MVDYKLFENILSQQDDGYVEEGDFIDYKLMELFASSNQSKVKPLFKKTSGLYPSIGYDCELKCEICGEIFKKHVNKTRLFEFISSMNGSNSKYKKHIVCDKCIDAQKKRDEESIRERSIAIQEQRILNTEKYIESYLNPNHSWNEGIKTYRKIQHLSCDNVYWGDIIDYIKDMDYYDFLKTPYWKEIAEKIKYKAGYKCQMCNSSENLITHHRTYENHGDEIHHMEDLICICKDCHEKHHFE